MMEHIRLSLAVPQALLFTRVQAVLRAAHNSQQLNLVPIQHRCNMPAHAPERKRKQALHPPFEALGPVHKGTMA
jgi:hypothetical protein